MRVVCIGDVHVAPGDRRADRQAAVEHIIDKELSGPRPVTLWVVLGDLSHGLSHGRMQPDDRNWWCQQLRRMANEAPVIIPYGNHDVPRDLDIFGFLSARFPIVVLDAPRIVDAKTAEGEAVLRVFVLPYPQKAGQVSVGASLEDARQALFTICSQAAEVLRASTVPGLVVGHLNIAGAVSSVGQPQIGQEIELDPSALALFDPRVPKVFGHIHKAQVVAGAFYAGSVCPMDWGETEAKSYLTIDYPEHPGASPIVRREELPSAPMFHVEGAVDLDDEGMHQFVWEVVSETPAPADWTGCDVRVRYSFPASSRDLIDAALVRAPFVGARRLKLEPIAMPDRQTRSPLVAQARTLDDKVLAWAEEARTTLTEAGRLGVLSALHELQGHDRDTVVAAVVARLKAQVDAVQGGAR